MLIDRGVRGTPVRARRCFLLALAVVATVTLARGLGIAGPDVVWASLMTVALALVARSCGATAGQLGLRWSDAGRGVCYGAAAFALVLVVLAGAAVVPATEGALHDARADIGGSQLVREILVTVVLLTAIPEEFAFRGVLLGSGAEQWGPARASLVVSGLFGLWHVQPTLATMQDNVAIGGTAHSPAGRALVVVGAVAVTFVAGLIFAWLRLRSRSLAAPVVAHVATNGLGLAVAWVVVHGPAR
jgi:CAAX protease family protein